MKLEFETVFETVFGTDFEIGLETGFEKCLKMILKLFLKLVGWFGWLKGQRGKMGVKGPMEKNYDDIMEDVSHRKTMRLAAGKKIFYKLQS